MSASPPTTHPLRLTILVIDRDVELFEAPLRDVIDALGNVQSRLPRQAILPAGTTPFRDTPSRNTQSGVRRSTKSIRPIFSRDTFDLSEVPLIFGDDDSKVFHRDGGNPQVVCAETTMLLSQLVKTTNGIHVERQDANEAKELNGLLQAGIRPDQLVIPASTPNFGVPAGQHFLDGDDGHRQVFRRNVADPPAHVGFTVQEQAQRVRVENPQTHGSVSVASRLWR